MEPYTELKRQAKQKRDLAIDKARAEYRAALREIDRLGRKLNGGRLKARYTANLTGDGSDLSIATTIKAAEIVLRGVRSDDVAGVDPSCPGTRTSSRRSAEEGGGHDSMWAEESPGAVYQKKGYWQLIG